MRSSAFRHPACELSATILFLSATIVFAQTPPSGAPPAEAAATQGDAAAPGGLPIEEIEKLVAPIALYPDVLVSQILPAATFPTDIVMASRWCAEHKDLKGLDDQKWDLSVISVCRYAPVLAKMNEDLDWTNALGAAFMDQPEDVMAAIQTLRHNAQASGVLQTTTQQTVVVERETVRIVPAEKEVVYVPQYNPQVIYVEDHDDDAAVVVGAAAASVISFGAGLALGAWLDNDCDWHHGCVVGCRPGYWGGWGWHGSCNWDNDWVAARGPRRGYVAGEHGGAYVGPRGAAVWGENGHGAAWRRPGGYAPPVYGGRYSQYNNVSGNRRNVASGNTVNVNNSKNVNIDRGDRANVGGGDRTNVGTGDRNKVGSGDRTNVGGGDRNRPGDGDRNRAGADRDRDRPGGAGANDRRDGNKSAFNDRTNTKDVGKQRDRGQQSREAAKPRPSGGGSSNQKPAPQQQARPSGGDRKPSSYNSQKSGGDVQRQSSRGSSSRSGGGGSRGGGSRGGGGRGGGRR